MKHKNHFRFVLLKNIAGTLCTTLRAPIFKQNREFLRNEYCFNIIFFNLNINYSRVAFIKEFIKIIQ